MPRISLSHIKYGKKRKCKICGRMFEPRGKKQVTCGRKECIKKAKGKKRTFYQNPFGSYEV